PSRAPPSFSRPASASLPSTKATVGQALAQSSRLHGSNAPSPPGAAGSNPHIRRHKSPHTMKVQFSGLGVVAGSGKIQGTVAARNRSGAYLRVKVTPVNPQTTYQQAARQRLTQF